MTNDMYHHQRTFNQLHYKPIIVAMFQEEVSTPCASTLFARSLKKYADVTFGKKNETRCMVVDFDYASFYDHCSISSDKYDPDKCDFDKMAAEIFKPGELWKSRELLKKVLNVIEQKQGWSSTNVKTHIRCNRYGNDDTTRDFTSGSLKAGCTFTINLKPLVKTSYLPESQKGKEAKRKLSYKPHWDEPVEILAKDTCTTHAGKLSPKSGE